MTDFDNIKYDRKDWPERADSELKIAHPKYCPKCGKQLVHLANEAWVCTDAHSWPFPSDKEFEPR